MSEETKVKIITTKIKNGTLLKGDKHPCWKGGKPWLRFKNPQYQEWRNAVLKRDGYVCQDCKRQCKKREKGLAAHHIKEYAKYPELRFEVSNGLTLCRECHMRLHGKELPPIEKIPCACGCGTIIDSFDRYGRSRKYVNYHAGRPKTRPEPTMIPCECGCGKLIASHNSEGKKIRFIKGHHSKGKPKSEETRRKIREWHTGRKLSEEHKRNVSIGLRNAKKKGRPPKSRIADTNVNKENSNVNDNAY